MGNGKTISGLVRENMKQANDIKDLKEEVGWLRGKYEILEKQIQNLVGVVRQSKNV